MKFRIIKDLNEKIKRINKLKEIIYKNKNKSPLYASPIDYKETNCEESIYAIINILSIRVNRINYILHNELNKRLSIVKLIATTLLDQIIKNNKQIMISFLFDMLPKYPYIVLKEFIDNNLVFYKKEEKEEEEII
jgi:hypothetical protein